MQPMRRKDRQMSEEFAWSVVDKCEYAVLSMIAEGGMPYAVTLTIVREGNNVYFHSAKEGRKIAALQKNPNVCLNCVGDTKLLPGETSTLFESAIAFGRAEEVESEEEMIRALRLLCQRHDPVSLNMFDKMTAGCMPRVSVWKIVVEEITGKAKQQL